MRIQLAGLLLVIACTPADAPGAGGGTEDGSTSAASTSSGPTSASTMSSAEATSSSSSTTAVAETGSDDGATTMSEPDCEAEGNVCVDAVPNGWEGPVAVLLDDPNPGQLSCGGRFPSPGPEGFEEISDPGVACNCSCEDPAGGSCEDPLGVEVYDVECLSANGDVCLLFNLNGDGCNEAEAGVFAAGPVDYLDEDDDGIRIIVPDPAVVVAPTCAAVDDVQMPESEISGSAELCAPNEPAVGVCAGTDTCSSRPASPFADALCIWSDGDTVCPKGLGYVDRQVLFRDSEDTRACTACSCGNAQAVNCTGEVSVVASDFQFTDPAEFYPADGSCSPIIAANGFVAFGVNFELDHISQPPTSTGCTESGGDPSGAVTALDPLTVCCMPLE